MSRTATLIYNPHAGFGSWHEEMRQVSQFWHYRGWHIILQPTQRAHHATELAREAARAGHELVLAAGGDGTLNEVANGLAHTETIMGVLPVGTGNSFARELGLPAPTLLEPHKLVEASRLLYKGYVQQMDLGQCNNGRYWLLWVGTGADGYVVDQVEPRTKLFKRLGRGGYAAKALFFLPSFVDITATVTVDEWQCTDKFLLANVSNCRLFGGGELMLNAEAVMDDGLFEIWLFRSTEDWPTLQLMRYILEVGLENHHDNPHVTRLRGRRVTIEAHPPTPYHTDGEPLGDTPVTCQMHPRALRLLVPRSAPSDLFGLPGETL